VLLIPVAFDLAARGINAFFRALEEAGAGFAPQFMLPMTELGRLLGTVMDGFISGAEEVTKFGDVAQVTQEELDKLTEDLSDIGPEIHEVVAGIGAGSVAVGEFASELDDLGGALSTTEDGLDDYLKAVERTIEAADILGISHQEIFDALDKIEAKGIDATRAWEELARAFEGQVSSEIQSVIKDLFGIGNAAEGAERKVISLSTALSRIGGKKGIGAAAAASGIGAGAGGLFRILQIEQEQGVSFTEAAAIHNANLRAAALASEMNIAGEGAVGTMSGNNITINIAGDANDPEEVANQVSNEIDRKIGNDALVDNQVRS